MVILLLAQIAHGKNSSSGDLMEAGRRAYAAGNYKQAEDNYRQVIAESTASNAAKALAMGELGSLLLTEGRTDEAEPMLDRAIAMIRSNRALDQRQLPMLLGMLGNLYQRTGRFSGSEKILNEALKLGTKLLRDTPQHISDLYNDLGVLHLAN